MESIYDIYVGKPSNHLKCTHEEFNLKCTNEQLIVFAFRSMLYGMAGCI